MPVRLALLGPVLAALLVVGPTGPADAAPPTTAIDTSTVSQGSPSSALAASRAARPSRTARQARVDRVLRIVKAQRGDRYQYGAAGPNRFDCSGLVYFAARNAGFRDVPRTSSQQGRFMRRIGRTAMRPGDFVFFTGRSGVYHVGVFAGRSDGRRLIVHAPGTGKRVRTDPIWTDRWFAATLR